jgi:hypothetical protein
MAFGLSLPREWLFHSPQVHYRQIRALKEDTRGSNAGERDDTAKVEKDQRLLGQFAVPGRKP